MAATLTPLVYVSVRTVMSPRIDEESAWNIYGGRADCTSANRPILCVALGPTVKATCERRVRQKKVRKVAGYREPLIRRGADWADEYLLRCSQRQSA